MDSESPDCGNMGEGLCGCSPKIMAAGGKGADRVGLAIPFQNLSGIIDQVIQMGTPIREVK